MICLPTEDGALLAFEHSTGVQRWQRRLEEHTLCRDLAGRGDLLFVGPHDIRTIPSGARTLLALDARTGALAWSRSIAAHSLSAATLGEGTLYVAGSDEQLYALDAADGAERWIAATTAWGPVAPALGEDLLIVGGRGDVLVALQAADGVERWRHAGGGWFAGPIAVAGGRVVALAWDGVLQALDAAQGRPLWQLRGSRGRGFSAPPCVTAASVFVGDRIYLEAQGQRAPGYALRALDAASGAERWRTLLEGRVAFQPVLAGDTLLCVEEEGQLRALDAASGAERWRLPLGAALVGVPTLAGDLAIVATRDDTLHAVRWRPTPALSTLAPEELLAHGDLSGAAVGFALDGALARAGVLYERLGRPREAAQLFERAGEGPRAAQLWLETGDFQRANELYASAGERLGVAITLERLGQPLDAARIYEQLDEYARAAALYEAAGDRPHAAKLYQRAGRFDEAARILAALGLWEEQVDVLVAAADLDEAARLCELNGQSERAADLFERAGMLADALRVRMALAHWPRVAELAEQLGDYERVAEANERLGKSEQAAAAYEQAAAARATAGADARLIATLFEQAERLYRDRGDLERAAACRLQVLRFRELPDLITVARAASAFVENSWNVIDVAFENVGFGQAREITVAVGGPFEARGIPVLHALAPQRKANLKVPLRPLPGEYGSAVPLELIVYYRNAYGVAYEEREQITIPVVQEGRAPAPATPLEIKVARQPVVEAAAALRPPPPADLAVVVRFIPQQPGVSQVTWESVGAGTAHCSFTAPYSGATLDLVMRALDHLQSNVNGLDSHDLEQLARLGLPVESGMLAPNAARTIGEALYRALTADSAAVAHIATVRNNARTQDRNVVVQLRFPPKAVELAALPWELIWGDSAVPLLLDSGQFLSITRHLDLELPSPAPRLRSGPLRILAVTPLAGIAAATRAQERAARERAWAGLLSQGAVEMSEVTPPVTRRRLFDALQSERRPDIIHFVGHGRYLDGKGYLMLDDDKGGWDKAPAELVAQLFREARLVVLHACQGGAVSEAGLLTGVAPALSAAGVPAVVAMQLTVKVDAAVRFSEVLYAALARDEPLQRAVSRARQALFVEDPDSGSWYVPTLTINSAGSEPFHL